MTVSPLVDANCEIIVRDANLEDDGEIRKIVKFETTIKLNEISSWQLEMHTDDWRLTNLNLGGGIMFRRDNEQLLTGPVMLVRVHELAGARTTTITGGCDNAWLDTRICYPVVEGLILEDGNYRFGKKRLADGITTTLTKPTVVGEGTCTVANATGFLVGAHIELTDAPSSDTGDLVIGTTDASSNVITLTTHKWGYAFPAGTIVTQLDSTGTLIDDPAYLGFDTRTGSADTVLKELVYFNAGAGACVDQYGPREIPLLTVLPSRAIGDMITSNARGEKLLAQVQNVAIAGNVNFQLKQVDQQLVFDVFKGRDLTEHSELVFSAEARNLKEAEYGFGLPEANVVMGVGPNAGVKKIMMPSADMTSVGQYGRFEEWEAALSGNSGDTPQQINTAMLASNNNALIQKANNSSISISLQETDQVRFPRDFTMGDRVRIMSGLIPTDLIVTNVYYTVPAGSGSGTGSAVGAFSKLQMSRLMIKQDRQGDLLNALLLN